MADYPQACSRQRTPQQEQIHFYDDISENRQIKHRIVDI
jgi:hypothetical protein